MGNDQKGLSILIFNSAEGLPSVDGEFIQNLFKYYEEAKNNTDNVGWKIIEKYIPYSHMETISKNLDKEKYKNLRFLNPQSEAN